MYGGSSHCPEKGYKEKLRERRIWNFTLPRSYWIHDVLQRLHVWKFVFLWQATHIPKRWLAHKYRLTEGLKYHRCLVFWQCPFPTMQQYWLCVVYQTLILHVTFLRKTRLYNKIRRDFYVCLKTKNYLFIVAQLFLKRTDCCLHLICVLGKKQQVFDSSGILRR